MKALFLFGRAPRKVRVRLFTTISAPLCSTEDFRCDPSREKRFQIYDFRFLKALDSTLQIESPFEDL
jgi:hypothetical protein